MVPRAPGRSVDLEKGVDDMAVHHVLQSPERDVLLVSALIATLVSLAFTGWGSWPTWLLAWSSPRCCWPQRSPTPGTGGQPAADRRSQGGAIARVWPGR